EKVDARGVLPSMPEESEREAAQHLLRESPAAREFGNPGLRHCVIHRVRIKGYEALELLEGLARIVDDEGRRTHFRDSREQTADGRGLALATLSREIAAAPESAQRQSDALVRLQVHPDRDAQFRLGLHHPCTRRRSPSAARRGAGTPP